MKVEEDAVLVVIRWREVAVIDPEDEIWVYDYYVRTIRPVDEWAWSSGHRRQRCSFEIGPTTTNQNDSKIAKSDH